MSLQSQKVKKVGQRVIRLQDRRNLWGRTERWAMMLYHEFLRDDVNIRAQSLAYLTIFSLLPLIAFGFLIFTFLSQFGMVQDSLYGMLDNFLSSIPPEHREFMNSYILRFKDAYLANLTKTSGSVGIFALLVLGWVGLQTFNNIDSTLNYLWSADSSRPFWEKVRNFIVVSVVAPIILVGGFSVPIILQRLPVTSYFFQRLPFLSVLLNYCVPFILILGTFMSMYRFVPVRRVYWKSAFWGGLFATVCMQLTQILMHYYFVFGTNSAYGKAGAIPIVGFWIYLLWIVVILGAEVSFLLQNGKDVFITTLPEPTFGEGKAILIVLAEVQKAHAAGTGPVSLNTITEKVDVTVVKLRGVLSYLVQKNLIATVVVTTDEATRYVLSKAVDEISIGDILQDYFAPVFQRAATPTDKLWNKSLADWLSFYDKVKVTKLLS